MADSNEPVHPALSLHRNSLDPNATTELIVNPRQGEFQAQAVSPDNPYASTPKPPAMPPRKLTPGERRYIRKHYGV